jgi:putative restriction endonuclease
MAKAIFTTKMSPSYDDRPEEYYHFPRTYLNAAQRAVGDHIIYYEPRRVSADDSSRGGKQAYFATARVEAIREDSTRQDHFYALITGYLDFDRPVPFVEGGEYYEASLRKSDGSTNRGAFGRAVRPISDIEFDRVLKSGFAPEIGATQDSESREGLEEPAERFERPIVELTISRPFRDLAFKRAIRNAYDCRCALTGLRLINGGGRPEVQAAHIMPVASKGPDSIRNGLALSSTVHWMFDRGLVTVDENYQIIAPKNRIPDQLRNILNQDGQVILPKDRSLWPHPHYLRFHRDKVFKG